MRKKHDIQTILDKGQELFRHQGYFYTGINEILKVSGIPKGSFYNFFQSKEDFAIKVVESYGNKMLAFIESQLSRTDLTPLERLRSMYRTVIESNASDEFTTGCMINNLMHEVAGLQEEVAEATHRNFQRWIARISECVAEGQEAGEIRKDIAPQALADYLHTSIYGAQTRMKGARDRAPLENWYALSFQFIQA